MAGAGEAARHLVLVTLDTVRADRIGAYGRQNAGTPRMDALAAAGTRFDRAYAHVPITLPSHMTILTGLLPARTGIHVNGQAAARPGVRTLAEVLSVVGFDTAAAVGGYPVSGRFPVRAGFARFDDRLTDPRNPSGLERGSPEVTRAALDAARARPDSEARLFLWVHYFDPHDPYEPPAELAARFAGDPYQGEIAHVDARLGELLDGLAGILGGEPTLVCVVADHGESLGEHGEDTHGFFLYEPTVRVPMILAGPGVPEGLVIERPVGTVDLAPTLLALLGIGAPEGLDGSEIDLRADEKFGETGTRGAVVAPVLLETELPRRNYGWSALAGAVGPRWKFIEAPRPEAYDLEADPGETANRLEAPLMPDPPAGALEPLRAAVRRYRDSAGAGGPVPPDGPDGVPVDPRLAALGYVDYGDSGDDAVPGDAAVDPKDRLATYRRFQRASRALEAGEPAAALPLLDALLAERDTPGVRFLRAQALRMSGRFEEAFAELHRVERADPAFVGVAMERTRMFVAQSEYAFALEQVDRYLAARPDDAEAWMFRGAAHEMAARPAQAEADYRHALEINPAFGGASLRLASLLFQTERYDESAAVLRGHLARFPDDELAGGLLGVIESR